MSMSLVSAVLLCLMAIGIGVALISYGFRGARGEGRK
jgi:hypothetical protein